MRIKCAILSTMASTHNGQFSDVQTSSPLIDDRPRMQKPLGVKRVSHGSSLMIYSVQANEYYN